MTGITYRSDLTRNLSASEVDGNFSQLTANKVETSVFSTLAAIGASAGTTQLTAGVLIFGNSNGVSFGIDGSTLTATVRTDYLTTAAQSGHSHGDPTLVLTNLSGSTASASNGLTISLSAAAPGGGAAISAAGSSQSSGTIVFSNSNGLSFGMNGSTVTGSHNGITSQTVQTQGSVQVQGSTGALVFSNSNGITFGGNASTITASHNGLTTAALSNHSHGDPTLALTNLSGTTASASNGLTLSLSAAAQTDQTQNVVVPSAGTQTATSGTVVFSNSNGISFGMSGSSRITASYTVPSTAGLISAINVSGGTTSNNLSALTFSNGNGVSFGLDGSTITASIAVPAGAQTGISGLANSETTYTSGSVTFSALGAITIRSTTGQQFQFSVNSQTVQTQSLIAAIYDGAASISTGTVRFSNSNGISFGVNGQTLTASHNGITSQSVQTQSNVQGISAGTQVGRTGDIVFSNSNGISFGLSGSNTLTASYTVPTQTAQTIGVYGSSQTYGQSSSSTVDARSLTVVGSGGVSVGMSAGSILISGQTTAAQSVQTQNVVAPSAGTQTATSGTVVFSNSNGISFGMSGSSRITASYTVPSTAGLLSAINLSAGTTSNNLSAFTFSNANGISFGLDASTITASYTVPNVPAQSAQTVGLYALGNTTQNSSSTLDARSLSFNGLGAATVGFSNGSIQLSVPVQSAQTQSVVQGISAGTQVARTGDIVFSNSNGISFGLSGSSRVTASYTVPSTAGLISAINVSGGTTSNNLSALTFSNGNGVSFGLDGSTITASVAAAGGAQTGISGLANSQTTYTSGTVSFSELGAITIRSTTGNQFQFSVNAQSVVPGIQTIAFANTTFTTGAVSFSNANGISFGSSGGQVTASYTVPTQSAQSMGIYGSSQTYGQSSSSTVDARSLSVVGSGGVSVGMSAGSLLISGQTTAAQTAQTQSNVQGIIVSDTTYRTGDVSFSNANGITFGSSAGQAVTINHALQFTSATSAITSNALHSSASRVFNIVAATNSTGGGTASLSSNVSFSNANGVSFYTSAGGAVVGSVQTNYLTTARASTDAIGLNTAQTNVTWTVNSSGLSLNAAGYAGTTTAITGGAAITLNSLGLRLDGAGLAGTSTGFTGANISGSLTQNSAGLAMSLSVAAPGGGGGVAISAGTQSVSTGTMVFSNSNGITFGMSGSSQITASYNSTQFAGTGTSATNASITLNSNGLAISVAAPGAAAENNWMAMLGANTAGNTTASGSTIGLSGLNLTLSGTNASQVVISAPATSSLVGASGIAVSTNGSTISVYNNVAPASFFRAFPDGGSSNVGTMGAGTVRVYPVVREGPFSVSRADIFASVSVSSSTNSSHAGALSVYLGIYTRTGSTLSLATSGSQSYQWSNTSNNSLGSITGLRRFSVPMDVNFTGGQDLFMAVMSRSSTTNANWFTASNILFSQGPHSAQINGLIGEATNNTFQVMPGIGIFSTTSSAMPVSMAFSHISYGMTASISKLMPNVYMVNMTA